MPSSGPTSPRPARSVVAAWPPGRTRQPGTPRHLRLTVPVRVVCYGSVTAVVLVWVESRPYVVPEFGTASQEVGLPAGQPRDTPTHAGRACGPALIPRRRR